MRNNRKTSVVVPGNDSENFSEKVLQVKRVTKVVKGGRRFSFSALVIVGNKAGKVGYGFGKANDVADAIKKATEKAKKNVISVKIRKGATLPHDIQIKFKASKLILKPATPGTGLITGGTVKTVLEFAGYKDVLSKILGSRNRMNIVRATFEALSQLKDINDFAKARKLTKNSDLWTV